MYHHRLAAGLFPSAQMTVTPSVAMYRLEHTDRTSSPYPPNGSLISDAVADCIRNTNAR